MKETFTDKLGQSKANIVRLNTINKIIEEYLEQGFVIGIRTLYYQRVSRAIVRKHQVSGFYFTF